jgi:hypothetical protein
MLKKHIELNRKCYAYVLFKFLTQRKTAYRDRARAELLKKQVEKMTHKVVVLQSLNKELQQMCDRNVQN